MSIQPQITWEDNPRLRGTVTGDGITDDAPAIQDALDTHTLVYLPFGKYRIASTLYMRSGCRLRLHPEAEIFFADGAGKTSESFLITNYPDACDITVTGGIWNGNRRGNPRVLGASREQLDAGAYLGIGISFKNVDGLHLSHMTIRDTEAFHIRIHGVKHFLIEHITFDDMQTSATQDGIHVGGCCEDGIIRHIRARGASSPNDDMISLITDFDQTNMMPEDPVYGQIRGDIRNIRIYDIEADNTFSFVRLLSGEYTLENIDIENVRGGCYYLALQLQISPYLRRGREDNRSGDFGTGHIRHVRIADWDVCHRYLYSPSGAPYSHDFTDCNAMIDIEQRIEGLTIENFHRDMTRDTLPALPTLYYKSFTAADVVFEGAPGTRLVEPTVDFCTTGNAVSDLRALATCGRTPDRLTFSVNDTERFAIDGDIAYLHINAK